MGKAVEKMEVKSWIRSLPGTSGVSDFPFRCVRYGGLRIGRDSPFPFPFPFPFSFLLLPLDSHGEV
jgi:hypothetical protein